MVDPNLVDLLTQLARVPAVSGREEGVASMIAVHLRACGEEIHQTIRTDALGNLYATITSERSGPRPTFLLSAHMDTIGLVVRQIEESGIIRVLPVGGVNRRTLMAQEVWIHGRERLFGVVGTTPPHLTTPAERKQIPPWEAFFVDTGMSGNDVAQQVRPGDWISFAALPTSLSEGRLTSPGLDNRAGVASVLWSGLQLAKSRRALPVNVILHFTVQEELGTRGASALAEPAPDAAIVVDVGFGEMPDVPGRDTIQMGRGPALTAGPNIHKEMRRFLAGVAERHEAPVQDEVMAGSSGTDAWEIQIAHQGIPTSVVSIPLRYMHSTVETVDLEDVQLAANLLVAACLEANPDDVRRWSGESVARAIK